MSQVLHINIPTATGHLEGILKPVDTPPPFVGVVCHPHPLYGGNMHNKVVFKVAQTLQAVGIPALRFNFRGVGHSTGTYDEGRGEMDDVRFALEFMSRRYPGVPAILAGFSFGAYVGLRVAANDDRVQAMIGLGVPARMFGEILLNECHKPKLFLHGTQDEQAPYDLTSHWFNDVPAPKSLMTIEGADHFFQGRLDEVQGIITEFIRGLESEQLTQQEQRSRI
ncbi:alpha/beta hydrolase [Tengunoibacter tsumagoiensis]|uniref:Alpha/beta hydrolase n=1 Tax=Tengunoibacter tsumagoiensis TaxID=2014871 RepID=A0A401ZVC0_9CHLR|nr:alpha/beta fold hydrolase [Tengunoibacter tsumagoiensis]GCE10859.1 alpha/beta hydrolase [Tengunoibacter tsumagoiensis]